jgi:hypothetical protein
VAKYERRQPEQSLLHQVIGEQIESFLSSARERDAPVAYFVERELRAYLNCGVLAHGFLRVRCDGCGHDRLVAFSCKGRGFCPSCGGRRMADTAAHLVDRVLPEVPVRQWVLTLPYQLRYRCAWDAKLTSDVLRAFLRALFADQRRRAREHHGIREGRCASVTFIQRFGSALNLTPHYHSLVFDGIYPGPAHTPGSFMPLPPPKTDDVARVMAGTARRIMRLLEKRGLAEGDDPLARDDPLLATLMAASIRSRIVTGPEAGQPWRRLGDRVEPIDEANQGGNQSQSSPPPRCVREGGMSVHADVMVPAHDRSRLERLCRYVARPPLALERLEALPNGLLSYRLKTRWRDGTTHVLMERRELLERLAPLIPPPRAHLVRYHGLLAPCASGRDRIVPGAPPEPSSAEVPVEMENPECGRSEPNTKTLAANMGVQGTRDAAATPLLVRTGTKGGKQGAGLDGLVSKAPNFSPTNPPCDPPTRRRPPSERRLRWAELLKRVFELDALRCPVCAGKMRVLAAITQPDVARRVLKCLSLTPRAPPIAPATLLVDQASELLATNALEVSSPEGTESSCDFDQTPPEDWDIDTQSAEHATDTTQSSS